MVRLVLLALVLLILCRWALGKWPWEYLKLAPTRSQAIRQARQLLAVSKQADRSEILDAHKRLVAKVHPDKGGSNAQVHEANAARDLLLAELPHDPDPIS